MTMEKIEHFACERGLLAKAMIEGLRAYCRAYFRSENLGEHLTDTVIGLAIITGQAEEKPLSASDIAAYTGLPRATVVRRLKHMQKIGLVGISDGGRRQPAYHMNVNKPEVVTEVVKLISRVNRMCADLSKMDGKPVAVKASAG